ncbi:ribonuclease P protein component [Taibaiella koreensis]|uniref:ribonuclease P protein component n=1 Tax=Taibaiella koreensis TaxID=1268548 RepID=UPI0013C2E638|nr:ribonuclease P protein component [Taibaiella koreensis]
MSTPSIHQRFTLQAIERLKLRKQIETLFQTGEAFSVFPLRLVFRLTPAGAEDIAPVRAGFSIPKKRIRKAVGRNRIRRLLREAWRLQKHTLYQVIPEGKQMHLFLIYSGAEKFNFEEACTVVKKAIEKLAAKVAATKP